MSKDRSVSKAASKLCMSQPAVSNALNRLRREFEDPLFVRTPAGMEPTPKATELAFAVQEGLTAIRAGLSTGMHFDPGRSDRRFRLLMTDVGEIAFLPRVLSSLKQLAPHIDLHVNEFGRESYEELLGSGAADLAVGRVKLSGDLCSQALFISPFIVLLSRKNPYLKRNSKGEPYITLEGYLTAPHVLLQPRGASGDPVGEALGTRNSKRRIALSVPHSTVLPMILGETDLVATVPKVCGNMLTANGAICAVRPPFKIASNHVYQWWHKRNSKDPGHLWLRQLIVSVGNDGQSAQTLKTPNSSVVSGD